MKDIDAAFVAFVMLLLVSPLFPRAPIAQPAQGNWVITGKKVVRNESITLDGNLTIESGGNLTLINAVLILNVQHDGEYGISVASGGSLYIYNSTIEPASSANRFTFLVYGDAFVMEGTTLKGVGWCAQDSQACYDSAKSSQYSQLGLVVQTSGARIRRNTISNCSVGLILMGSNDSVESNTIGPNDVGAVTVLGNDDTVVDNTILHMGTNNTFIVYLSQTDGDSVVGNKYVQDSKTWITFSEIYAIFLSRSDSDVIANNSFSGSWGNDLDAYGNGGPGSQVVITNNTISDASGTGLTGLPNVVCENNFVNNAVQASVKPGVQWDCHGIGNYWSGYSGTDLNLDGVGDAPYSIGSTSDPYPVLQPSGWLTMFYLNVSSNLPSLTFTINGSVFGTAADGTGTFRLGYDALYAFAFPQTLVLPNGTAYQFANWGDGYASPARTLALDSNSTVQVFYFRQPQVTTSSTSVSTTRSSTTHTTTVSASSTGAAASSSTEVSVSSTSRSSTSSEMSTSSTPASAMTTSSSASSGGGPPDLVYAGVVVVAAVAVALAFFLRKRA
jgi:Periplasmic copper-binding protein (NosD)